MNFNEEEKAFLTICGFHRYSDVCWTADEPYEVISLHPNNEISYEKHVWDDDMAEYDVTYKRFKDFSELKSYLD